MRIDQYVHARREKLVFKIIFLGIPFGILMVGIAMGFSGGLLGADRHYWSRWFFSFVGTHHGIMISSTNALASGDPVLCISPM